MEEVSIIGIDLAKRSFQLHGAKADGSVAYWSYPAFTDGWFLWLMVSDMVPFLPRHSSERGNVHRRRGEQPGEVRSASVAPASHLRFRPHG